MKKSTRNAQASSGVVAMALVTAMAAHAASFPPNGSSATELDRAETEMADRYAIASELIEAELAKNIDTAVWEIDIVDSENQIVTVTVDALDGKILSTGLNGEAQLNTDISSQLEKAINVVRSIENGALIEAEMDHDMNDLFWQVRSDGDDALSTYRINAQSGELFI